MNRLTPFQGSLLGLGLFTGLAIGLLLLSLTAEERALAEGRGSSFSQNDRGSSLLYEGLGHAGVRVERLVSGRDIPLNGTLLLLEPDPAAARQRMAELDRALSQEAQLTLVICADQAGFEPFARLIQQEIPPLFTSSAPIRTPGALNYPPAELALDTSTPLRVFSHVPSYAQAVVEDEDGLPLLLECWMGEAHLYFLSEPRLLENRWIGNAGNLELALSLVSEHERLCIDERWRKGAQPGSQPLMNLVYGTAPGRAAALLALLLLLLHFLKGAPLGGGRRRTFGVRPLGDIVEHLARRHLHAKRPASLHFMFQKRFHRRACTILGVPQETDPGELARLLSGRGFDAVKLDRLLRSTSDSREVVERARGLERLLEQLRTRTRLPGTTPFEAPTEDDPR